ncbi:MAG: adenylate/guanylate cyclase domain-containing protein [Anaerolineales bacterium]
MLPFLNRGIQRLNQLEKYPLAARSLARFRQFIAAAAPHELYRVNPRYLAEKLAWGQNETLDMLTYAAAEDLWRLHWEAYCPACGGLLDSTEHLGDLQAHQHCQACNWRGAIALDQEVIVDASLNEQVRRLPRRERENPAFQRAVEERLGRMPALALINRPLFRELLGDQTLPPNQALGVQRLVIFFSDLKGSTAMYERLGDAEAYRVVNEHFQVLFAAVEEAGGAAVKTMGDGVMGTFFDAQAALKGIAGSMRGIRALNERLGLRGDDALRLKVGLHSGACIVVTLNHRLDYFGTTVNVAARLSDLSQGDDVVVSAAVLEDMNARQTIHTLGEIHPLEASIRGLSRPLNVYRLRVGEGEGGR